MGVSVSASTAIILVAALISFGMVNSVQDDAQNAYLEAQASMQERYNDAMMTSLEINPAVSVYDGATFQYSNITVTNTGDRPIEMNTLSLMINGGFHPYSYTNLNSPGSQVWLPGEVTVLRVSEEFDVSDTHRIWVISANGATDLLVYGGS